MTDDANFRAASSSQCGSAASDREASARARAARIFSAFISGGDPPNTGLPKTVKSLGLGECTENPIRVADVMASSLMSVVNGWRNKLLSPGRRSMRFASRPSVMRFQTTVDHSLIRGLVTRIDRYSSGGFPMSKRGRRCMDIGHFAIAGVPPP